MASDMMKDKGHKGPLINYTVPKNVTYNWTLYGRFHRLAEQTPTNSPHQIAN